VLVARQQVELDVRIQAGKIGEPGTSQHWAMEARVQRQGARQLCSLISSTS
jgi:hypothetical protein